MPKQKRRLPIDYLNEHIHKAPSNSNDIAIEQLMNPIPTFQCWLHSMTRNAVQKAETADDLSSLLKLIPLHQIKDFLHSTMDSMDPHLRTSLYMRMNPIDNILSNDVIQLILSFLPFQSTNTLINKNFYSLIRRNMMMKECKSRERDYETVIQSKHKEIKVLRAKKIKEMRMVTRKYDPLIHRFKSDLEHMMHAEDESLDGIKYCRRCITKRKTDDMIQCSSCFRIECVECINGCNECGEVYCGDCREAEFSATQCGLKLCDGCFCRHDKVCECHSKYW